MARAVSTVLDVAVCLLLVGAAVATLATAPPATGGSGAPDAAPAASGLATVTASVPAAGDRRVHDTLAGHLGDAAVVDARLDGAALVATGYPGAVAEEVEASTADRTHVTARWEPYPGAPLAGAVTAGEPPPPGADVAATRLTVDSGLQAPGTGGADSFAALADALAGAYVGWLFPPERTYAALADSRTAPRTAARYRTAAGALETDPTEAVAAGEVHRANGALSAALADRLAADLRARYGTPRTAAADLTVAEVEVVVRRWQP